MLVADNGEILVDPGVSQAKFNGEVERLLARRWEEHRRGWFLIEATFPTVFVIFAKPDLHPKAVLFGVEIDFSNYDLWAPSVRLVDPFTRTPYKTKNLPNGITFLRWRDSDSEFPSEHLLQSEGPEKIPFLCFPGTREYHQHPAHTGDSWLLHRNRGEGTLYFLLEKIYDHGVTPIAGFQVSLQPQIGGFALNPSKVPK